ncbi:metal-dependent hydrolase [Flavobacteriaceae bacterium S0825]|uniref:metal-dependent hydrolase n=1 Tax=Gaetbulibacter sp. S0825 TaxID=2720084 RepID=UPI001430E801|nr:metal-dependent hydrolase [Gaetbulibacter sp. S0825]MCK0109502.1 metal-dependent hydrolase [Flavobacteriaceae bacterium S0825]NIX65137.1 metal-dependent hydrolase [Gaetbulibacter sp. S0825]
MDSLTQIVLGAACGEAALGKKIGNKALLFGAIGGTIPDLDVFVGRWIYNNEIDIMAFHRGFMHSILFTVIGAFIFGWITYRLYNRGKRKGTTIRNNWIWLFFLSLFTHPILDSFTPYGTQLFTPFSNYRVAINNISVADPMYTVPFLICMIVLMFFKRSTYKRRLWLKFGLGISSAYMLFTLVNKIYITSIYKKSLQSEGISYLRFQTQPSIFNNILWYGVAETETDYYVGFYSLFDLSSKVETWNKLPKNHHLAPVDNKDIKTLAWFSNGYYNLIEKKEGILRYNDLRYPSFDKDDPNNAIFSFTMKKEGERWNILPFDGKPPSSEDFSYFWERIKGVN